jgi:hypothetical protein
MKAIQTLNAMINASMMERYPMIRPELLRLKPMRCNSANTLTQCVKKFLQLKGHQCERINTMGRRLDHTRVVTDVLGYKRQIGSVKFVPGTGTKGSADLSAIVRTSSGVVIPWKIEVKWGSDRLRPEQIEYSKDIFAAGGHYSVVKDFEDFFEQYNQLIMG